jgi:opacity protein-like surface antigen
MEMSVSVLELSMPLRSAFALIAIVLLPCLAVDADAQSRWTVDFENGAAIAGYNDVRIPGDTGTLFSLTDDLASQTAYFWRVRVGVRLAPRHEILALAAPLTLNSSGTFDRPVFFVDTTFDPGTPVTGRYVFNSYRVTYRYTAVQSPNWRFGIGVTGKIRDASTRLEAPGKSAEKTNVGFVPLVNFALERRLGSRATFQVEGDALAAPQGRAEDIFAGVLVAVNRNLSVKAGYRFLEGGADNDEVYTFALIHYVAAGAVIRF